MLAYSTEGSFGTGKQLRRNDALQEWMKTKVKQIKYLNKNEVTKDLKTKIKSGWASFAPPIEEGIPRIVNELQKVDPLLNTKWGQGCGYNSLLADCTQNQGYYSCGKVWVGCVATAMAQIMKYQEHPNSYDWNDMPNTQATNETANLMKDIGVAVKMDWSCEGAGAYMFNAEKSLINEFNYPYATLMDFDMSALVMELEHDKDPVILSGGNHAWVCSGYRRWNVITIHNPGTKFEYRTYDFKQSFLYMNWGWDGAQDGWFLVNDFTPSDNNFNSHRKMIINIEP